MCGCGLIDLEKRKVVMLYGGIAASVLSKLFINGNERRHTTDAPWALAQERNSYFRV